MTTRPFGVTGVDVSAIGFGAWAIGGSAHGNSYGSTDDAESHRALERALELGCTFFDTADVYGHGHSETILGEVLDGSRDKVFIATKVGGDFYGDKQRQNFSSDYIRFAIDKSLERLRTDYVDLYQLHNPPDTLVEQGEVFEILGDLKDEGIIRHFGISIHNPSEGLVAMKQAEIASIQVVYNILNQRAAEQLFPAAESNGVAIIAREPLNNGFLAGRRSWDDDFEEGDIRRNWPDDYRKAIAGAANALQFLAHDGRTLAQAALRFTIAPAAVSVVIPGCKTVAQTEENLAAADVPPLTDDELARVREVLSAT